MSVMHPRMASFLALVLLVGVTCWSKGVLAQHVVLLEAPRVDELANLLAVSLPPAARERPTGTDVSSTTWTRYETLISQADSHTFNGLDRYGRFRVSLFRRQAHRVFRAYNKVFRAGLGLLKRATTFEDQSRAAYGLARAMHDLATRLSSEEEDEVSCGEDLLLMRVGVVAESLVRIANRYGTQNLWTLYAARLAVETNPWRYPLAAKVRYHPFAGARPGFISSVSRGGRTVDFSRP